MSTLLIDGGRPLSGLVRVGGSKNAVLPMMAAAILADGPVELEGVPRLTDVTTQALVLQRLGMDVAHDHGPLRITTRDDSPHRADDELVARMRASFCVLGPLLARRGRAVVPLPGGCNLGDRPVDLHLKGLAALGAHLRLRHGYVVAEASRLCGAPIDLAGPRGPTVTGTANVLSAAVLAHGTTVIHGAAREPEIVDLGAMLNAMGARITGLGTPQIRIEGVRRLCGVRWRVIPDRIEAATLLLAVAITGSAATVTGVVPEHLAAVLAALRQAGAAIDLVADAVSLRIPRAAAAHRHHGPTLSGRPQRRAGSVDGPAEPGAGPEPVRDTVFPQRFLHAAELRRMGALIRLTDGQATIDGVPALAGAMVRASDLRASAALVLAGLAARGRTTIVEAHHLDRGYEALDVKLACLGAHVQRLEDEATPRPPNAYDPAAEPGCASSRETA